MSTPAEAPSGALLDDSLAAFMQRGISVVAGARDRHNIPVVARASGCRVSPDRRKVTVFISATQAGQLLRCVREIGEIAVVFSEPSTHRTVQIKGKDASVGRLEEGDLERVTAYRDAFAREIELLRFDELLIQTMLSYPPADIVTLNFTPSEAYSQTPGPCAGQPLRSGT